MGEIQCCQRPGGSAVCTAWEDSTESKFDERSKSLSLTDLIQEEECKRNFKNAEALAKASVEPGAQSAEWDETPVAMDMATLWPVQDVTVDGQGMSRSILGRLDHPASKVLGQSDQTRLIDMAITEDVKSGDSPSPSTRADSDQQSTVDDSISCQSPSGQEHTIVVPGLEAFRERRMAAVSFAKPSEPTNGWCACGDGQTECWVKVDFKRKPWTTNVFIAQPSSLAMVHYGTDGLSGLIPIFCEISKWPEWFPFARETTCLHTWEDGTELWHLKLRVAAFSVDTCMVAKVCDHILDLGYVEIVITTPAADAKDVCGVTLPKKQWSYLRAECDMAKIRFTPTSLTNCTITVELAGNETLPAEWVVRHLWSTIAKKVVPLIASQQDPWRKRGVFSEVLEGPHGDRYRSMHSHVVQRMNA